MPEPVDSSAKRSDEHIVLPTCEDVDSLRGELVSLQAKYDALLDVNNLALFEFDILTGQMILPKELADLYDLPLIVENAIDELIARGIIREQSESEFRRIYREVSEGAPDASATLINHDADGNEIITEIKLRTVFSQSGEPVKALAFIKDATEERKFIREEQYLAAITSRNLMTFVVDIDRDIVMWAKSIVPQAGKEVIGETYSASARHTAKHEAHPDDMLLLLQLTNIDYWKRSFETGHTQIDFEYRRRNTTQGPYVWVHSTINILKDELTGHLYALYQAVDIHEEKTVLRRAATEQGYFKSMIAAADSVKEINVTKDRLIRSYHNGKQVEIPENRSYREYTEQLVDSGEIYIEDAPMIFNFMNRERITEIFAQGERTDTMEYRRINDEGVMNWFLASSSYTQDPETGDILSFTFVVNINDQKVHEQELSYKANYDGLTRVLNKVSLKNAINEAIREHGRRESDGMHAFMVLDIDYFKSVNDEHGHAFGDIVITDFAERVKKTFRENDIIGRVGGDEFVVLLKDARDRESVAAKAQELVESAQHTYDIHDKRREITVSVGIALLGKDGMNFAELFEHADKALYAAKSRGRNQYAFYDSTD